MHSQIKIIGYALIDSQDCPNMEIYLISAEICITTNMRLIPDCVPRKLPKRVK